MSKKIPTTTKEQFSNLAKATYPNLKHHQALNRLAADFGYPTYNALQPILKNNSMQQTEKPLKQCDLKLEKADKKAIGALIDKRHPIVFLRDKKIVSYLFFEKLAEGENKVAVVYPHGTKQDKAIKHLYALLPEIMRPSRNIQVSMIEDDGLWFDDYMEEPSLPFPVDYLINSMEYAMMNNIWNENLYFIVNGYRVYAPIIRLYAMISKKNTVKTIDEMWYISKLVLFENVFPLLKIAKCIFEHENETKALERSLSLIVPKERIERILSYDIGYINDGKDALESQEELSGYWNKKETTDKHSDYFAAEDYSQQLKYYESTFFRFFLSIEKQLIT